MREIITTGFEVVGLLMLAVAFGLSAAALWIPLGFAAAAVVLIAESWYLNRPADPSEGEDTA